MGIFIGFAGVALLVGNDLRGDSAPRWWSILMVMIVCVCYGSASFIVQLKLADVPSFGVIAVSLSAVAASCSRRSAARVRR